jgi:Flp pilus assembly protein TadG
MMRTLRRCRRTARSDSGITTLQVLIMFPVIAVVFGIAMQMALNYYAKQVALAAAQEGVNAVRFSGNPGLTAADETQAEQTATAAANAYLAKHEGNMLTSPQLVNPVMTPPIPRVFATSQITVEITGQAISLFPLLSTSVDQQSWGTVELFYSGKA